VGHRGDSEVPYVDVLRHRAADDKGNLAAERQMISIRRFSKYILPAAVLLSSCGGGGGSGTPPPSALSYTAAPAFIVMQPITALKPTYMGTVTSFSVSPALPAGLNISSVSGIIYGTPTAISAQANYTVTASGPSGVTTAQVPIVVNDVPPTINYSSAYYSFTNGVAAQTLAPSAAGGAVVTWGIVPALPDGLTLSATDGRISGTPTAGAAAAVYVVTATNSGGRSIANLTIAVSPAPVLDLGHGDSINLIRMNASRVFSQDLSGHWALWDYSKGTNLANGTPPCLSPPCASNPLPADFSGSTIVIGTPTGFDVRSSAAGQLLATVAATFSWWKLATDGTYVCAGSTTGLQAWSTSGQVLVSRSGDYSNAMGFAAPGEILIALGPAGAGAIETISLATGTSSVGPPFQGTFLSWFLDGTQFFTNDTTGNRIRIYSDTTVQNDMIIPNGSLASNVAGERNWFWTYGSAPGLNIYQVGASAAPTASFAVSGKMIPSGTTLGFISSGNVSVVDLSGAAPTLINYPNVPLTTTTTNAYAAASSTQWMIGDQLGVLFDGGSLSGTARYFGYGALLSIAGGAGHFAIATASGATLYFNSATNALEGTIDFLSSKLVLSADGTVLAAQGSPSSVNSNQLNIYSLPSGALVTPFLFGSMSMPTLVDMTLSASGTVVGAEVNNSLQALPVGGGTLLWTVPGPTGVGGFQWRPLLSPDGTLTANAGEPEGGGTTPLTSFYSNGTFITSRTGWAVGWIDNGRLLVNNYDDKFGRYMGASIYDPTGALLASPAIPGLKLFQVVTPQQQTPDLIYSPEFNTIYSLISGATLWASGSPSTGTYYPGPPGIGAVAGPQIVFMSGNLLLAEPH
jgi:hypothetical protein